MEKMRKVLVIRANSLDRENRAVKVINTLLENDFQVGFLGWDRGSTVPRSERSRIKNPQDGTQFQETYFNFKSPWGKKSMLLLPFWWIYLFYQLMVIEWDAAHTIQIISLPPVAIAGKIRRKQVVYDILDTYEDSIIIHNTLRNLLMIIDKLFIRISSNIVLADEAQITEFNGIPHPHVTVLYDSPEDVYQPSYRHGDSQLPAELRVDSQVLHASQLPSQAHDDTEDNSQGTPFIKPQSNGDFTLFFAGQLNPGKKLNLENMFEAVKTMDNVKIVIAGHGDLVETINNYSHQMPGKIEFIGEISHSEVLKRSLEADALFMIRDPILLVNKYICGSKVLEAMMCSKAIIVSQGTSTATKVITENCGLVVDPHNVENLQESITTLKNNPTLCRQLGTNGRKAYEERYSWKIMKKD